MEASVVDTTANIAINSVLFFMLMIIPLPMIKA